MPDISTRQPAELRFWIIGIASLLLLGGCRQTPTDVGISKIPVYPGARLTSQDKVGAMMGDEISRLEDYTSTIWSFKTSASADEVLKYYQENLKDAHFEKADPADQAGTDEDEDEDAEEDFEESGEPMEEVVLYTLSGALGNPNSGEEFTVEIGDGWFAITEMLKD